jgi:hypothetical protein
MIIDSREKPASLAGEWIVALALSGLALIFIGIAFHFKRSSGESMPMWIAGAFLLAGLGKLCSVTYRVFDSVKFGRIRLHLRATPVVVGGPLDGELEFPKKASLLRDVVASLACVRVKWHSQGGTGIRLQEDIWITHKHLDLVVRGQRGRAALRFDVPVGQPDSTVSSSSGWTPGVAETVDHGWELRLKAVAPGLNLERRFPIIVVASSHH